jgi:hypothetical protein
LPEEEPLSVRWAVVAVWISAISYIYQVRLDLSLPASLPATLIQPIAFLMFLFALAIALGFTWLVARGVRRGHGWARSVLLSLFILFLPFKVFWLVSHGGMNLASYETLGHLALDCSVVALLFTGAGRSWFSTRRTFS